MKLINILKKYNYKMKNYKIKKLIYNEYFYIIIINIFKNKIIKLKKI